MTCNITTTPLYTEPLPLYQRDPETASIRSAAPSYVSDAPTYTSRRQSIPAPNATTNSPSRLSTTPSRATTSTPASASPPRLGLPSPRYAPGFQSRAHGSSSDLSAHNYNISHWSNIHSNHQSRQYENVARRRASQAVNTTLIINTPLSTPLPPSTSHTTSSTALDSSAAGAYPADTVHTPTSPLEDPYLVGEEAAEKARKQRIYREMCLRGEEALKHESKTWDFMLGQMADWEERERSWGKFRETVNTGRTKLLGRRIGLGGGRFGL
ncbi:hypothetical protein BU16DRAFT_177849 [Lophium mytilinum]|uniref:Uncharacterized protein n=1 Tax=Lophium mytilinum TaxID=390894 RepID=A0A6A6QCV6_9PEZI|nr:hypothetical protein BU16DRAFT_177849 [Lophium mytilinum]